jgi:hypothetical protein
MCNYAAITDLKCKWDYEDDLPLGVGSQTNMTIEFDDSLLPVDMSNMLTDMQVPITVPMRFRIGGYNNNDEFYINVSDKDDYEEYLSYFTSDLTIRAGNVFVLSRATETLGWRTLCVGMQKNSDTYEWDIEEGKQRIEVTNIGRIILETIKTRWLRWLPVYINTIETRQTYIDHIYAYANRHGNPRAIQIVGTIAASADSDGSGTVQFAFISPYEIDKFILMIAAKLAQYYLRLCDEPAINDYQYRDYYQKQTYNDCTGAIGGQVLDPYVIACVITPYIGTFPRYIRNMYGGVCFDMEERYTTAWDYYVDSAKSRFKREHYSFQCGYPTESEIALGATTATWEIDIIDAYYGNPEGSRTVKAHENMIYDAKFKVRDNVFNRVTAAPPDKCAYDINSFTVTSPSSASEREYNIPIIFNNLPAIDDAAGAKRGDSKSDDPRRFLPNFPSETDVRYSWATYHGWQMLYKETPYSTLFGGDMTRGDVFIRAHENMKFNITYDLWSKEYYDPAAIDFTTVTSHTVDNSNFTYIQNNSGEPLIKANVFLKLLGSSRQSTLEGTTRLDDDAWFRPTYGGFTLNLSEIAPPNNPSKFSELADYFVVSCAEIDARLGTVEFKAYGLNLKPEA